MNETKKKAGRELLQMLRIKQVFGEQLTECTNPLDPSKYHRSLMTIMTGTITPTSANVDQAIDIGKIQIIKFEN